MANVKIKAQVAIEFTITLFCLFILLVAVTKMFAWFGNSIVERHKKYESTRSAAATASTTSSQIDFYKQTPLDIFGDKGKDWNYKLAK